MWYTLPWVFDEFFHDYIPFKWITKLHVFHRSSQTTTATTTKSSLRTLDASGQILASCLSSLPQVVLDDYIETLYLSFFNQSIGINLLNLRNLTLVNSINCLNCCSRFPSTIRSVRIVSFHRLSNYILPNWPVVVHSLSTLPQLTSLGIFMYDLLETVDDDSCQIIAKAASLFSNFIFCFRHKYEFYDDDPLLIMAFKEHEKCIKQLCHYIFLLIDERSSCYSIESDGYGLTIWS